MKYLQDIYSEILGMLDFTVMDERINFKYWYSNVQEFTSGKSDNVGLGCGSIYLGSLRKVGIKGEVVYVFSPDSFSRQMAKSLDLSPTDIISFSQIGSIDCLQRVNEILDPVLKSLEFSF